MDTVRKTDYEMIICTCEKFSDLWDANILLLNRNFPERGKTFLATDFPTGRIFEKVTVVSAGEGAKITGRISAALSESSAEYILLCLEDYFLTEPVEDRKIREAIGFMEEEKIDYLRLYGASERYLRREGARESGKYKGFWLRNISEGSYKISLYPGIWRRDFLLSTLGKELDPWEYEVSLTEYARSFGAKCAISCRGEFPFLDVIRKGKILRKAARYFQKNPIYSGNREKTGFFEEFLLDFRTFLRRNLPAPLFLILKYIMMKLGMKFYSPLE